MRLNINHIFFSLTAVFFWSTISTAYKLTLAGMNAPQLLFYSSLFSCLVFFAIYIYKRTSNSIVKITLTDFKKSIFLGILNPFLFYLILVKAYELLPAQEALAINYFWPVVLSSFSIIFLKQKFSFSLIIGAFAAFIGVLIVALHGDIFHPVLENIGGRLLAFFSTFVWSGFWILNIVDKREVTVKLLTSFIIGTFITGVYIFVFNSFNISDSKYFLGAAYIGLFEMGITFFLWLKGLELSPNKAKTATLANLAPLISILFISQILGEKIMISSVLGLFLILAGIFIQNYKLIRK